MAAMDDSVVSAQARADFHTQGAICLRGVFGEWVEPLREVVEHSIRSPGPLVERYSGSADQSGFFGDRYRWTFDEQVREFVMRSPAAAVAGRVMNSERVNLFCDHLFVKEPGAERPTPWHQDLPYWPLAGTQVCSIWISLDEVTRSHGSLQFVAGSHRWNRKFRGRSFSANGTARYGGEELEDLPDIDADRNAYDILGWDMAPGDCVVFHAMALHGAAGNAHADRRRRAMSTRWLGDDVTYRRVTGLPEPIRDPGLADGAPIACDLFPTLWRRGRAEPPASVNPAQAAFIQGLS